MTEHLDIHYVKLFWFKKREEFKNDLERWMAFFKYEGKEEEIMETLTKDNPTFQKAHEQYEHFREDKELMALYDARRKWRLENNTQMSIARMEGLEDGRKESKKAIKEAQERAFKEEAARKSEETARKEAQKRASKEEAARKKAEEIASKETARREELEEELKRLRSKAELEQNH